MTVVCIVQARMTSTRLPGKVMLSLGGEPVICHVLRRCQEIPGVDIVVAAVADGTDNAPIVKEAEKLGVKITRGHKTDVVRRMRTAADAVRADIIVRVTHDCPLIDPDICGRVLELLIAEDADYASNVMPRTYTKGLDCEVFTRDALERTHKEADDPDDREHICPYMQRNLYTVNLDGGGDSGHRWCLDDLEDYIFLSNKFARL